MNEKTLGDVSLADIYTRIGRVEQVQQETNRNVSQLAKDVAELKAGLNDPLPLKERVSKLETRWQRIVGAIMALGLVYGGIEGAKALVQG